MKVVIKSMAIAIFLFFYVCTSAQVDFEYGIWQTAGRNLSVSDYPDIRGRLLNFKWKDLEPRNNSWDWKNFDSELASSTEGNIPVIFMVFTKEDAPEWLYNNGVEKVTETDNKGKVTGHSPYYADPDYKKFFKRMIMKVRQHVETLQPAVRNNIIGVQACFGSTGDYISYKGNVPDKYYLTGIQFYDLFTEFTTYYYDEYKNTRPKITLLSNPHNNGSDQNQWLLENCPGTWIKTGSIGKGYQLNDEKSKASWLVDLLNTPRSGEFVRARSEMSGQATSAPWWKTSEQKNLFALLCYDIFWGLDWSNQGGAQLKNPNNDSIFRFFNKYAGEKDPSKSLHAMCALKDVLDAADEARFPASKYGSVSRTNTARYDKIAKEYAPYGALLKDPQTATKGEMDNLGARGINDVGWDLLPGNYERYLYQIKANETSVGYWNISSSDPQTMYGRFGRGFDINKNKKAFYFDLDDKFLNNMPLNAQYPVTIDITYLDKGAGSFQVVYDGKKNANAKSVQVNLTNTNKWKKASITLRDAYFGNRGVNKSDFSIRSTSNNNIIFSIVELSRGEAKTERKKKRRNAAVQTSNMQAEATTENAVMVAPNPVINNFTLRLKESKESAQVQIYDLSGKLVYQNRISGSEINISKQQIGNVAGTYIIKVTTPSKTYSTKLLVL